MDKEILVQYCEMKEEIKDIRRRKEKLEKEIKGLGVVSDSVKGTRRDGTYGSIKITGYPTPEYYRKKAAVEKLQKMLDTENDERGFSMLRELWAFIRIEYAIIRELKLKLKL